MNTRVLVSGTGKMGRQVAAAVAAQPDFTVVGYVDGLAAATDLDGLPVFDDAASAIEATRPALVIDFTNAAWTPVLAREALAHDVRMVIGTTSLPPDFMAWLEAEAAARKVGVVLAANFAIGAILMMYFAQQASRFFDNAEIIELHHDQKIDAPSGTAKTTAERMVAARQKGFTLPRTEKETVPGTRGGELDGIAIHSVRLPGFVASQEVIFGGLGQTLTIRHDTTGRDSFMPGVVAASRAVLDLDHLVIGLDALFGLS